MRPSRAGTAAPVCWTVPAVLCSVPRAPWRWLLPPGLFPVPWHRGGNRSAYGVIERSQIRSVCVESGASHACFSGQSCGARAWRGIPLCAAVEGEVGAGVPVGSAQPWVQAALQGCSQHISPSRSPRSGCFLCSGKRSGAAEANASLPPGCTRDSGGRLGAAGLNRCREGLWGRVQPSSLQPLSALHWGLQCGLIAAGVL